MKTLAARCLFIVLLLANHVNPLGARVGQRGVAPRPPLKLSGEVLTVEKISEDAANVGFKVQLRLTISNGGNEAIIIYRDKPWVGAVEIAGSLSEASSNKYLHRASAWPNAWGISSRQALHKKLDKPKPPADITLVLHPGESWKYEAAAYIGFEKKDSYDGKRKAWSEIKRHNPLWLQVTIEMWPVNAEPGLTMRNPKWGKELRKRWKAEGNLWLDYLTSEPIKLELPSAVASSRRESQESTNPLPR